MGEFMRNSLGPLLNPNNLAGYMNLGVFGAVGLMLMRKPPLPRWPVALGAALLLGTVIEAGSRGGFLALGGGLLLLAPIVWRRYLARSSSKRAGRSMLVSLTAVIGLGVTLALLAVAPQAFSRVDDASFKKLAMASWVMPLLADHPLVGVGRGAFESVFQGYRIGQNNLIYSHAENFVIQWAAEWGIPVCLLALGGFAWCLRPRALGVDRSSVALGALAGLLVLLAQNVVDLGLEVPAVAIAAAVSIGSCWGGVASSSARSRISLRIPTAAVLAFGLLTLTIGTAFSEIEPVGQARYRLERSLSNTEGAQKGAVQAFRAELRAAALAHPADPYFARLGAVMALRAKDESPMPWLDRALELGLMNGRTHLLLARTLAGWGRTEQALLELRFAASYDPELAGPVAQGALSLTREASRLYRAAPQGDVGAKVLAAMARTLTEPHDQALHLKLMQEAVQRSPRNTDVRAQLGKLELSLLTNEGADGPCIGEGRQSCVDDVGRQAEELMRLAPAALAGVELRAKLWMLLGRNVEAIEFLERRCPKIESRRKCQLLLLEATALTHDVARSASLARATVAEGCEDMSDCGHLYASVAEVLARANQNELALTYYQQAAHEDPSDARWMKVASLAASLGQHGLAIEALTKVERRRGRLDPALRARLEEQKLKLVIGQSGALQKASK